MPILRNVKCNWASVQEPNISAEYGNKWEIEAELDAATAKQFNADGFKTKQNDKGVETLRFKRKTTGQRKKGGTFDKQQPRVVDAQKQPFTDLIGNGSLVNIAYNVVEHNFGKSLDLSGVQIVNLVPYGGKHEEAADEFDTVDSDIEEVFDGSDIPF